MRVCVCVYEREGERQKVVQRDREQGILEVSFFCYQDNQVDFILMIIKNASVSYYKLSFKLGPLSLSTRIENF